MIQPLQTLAGYTVCCMYNINVCTTTQLTARRPHTNIYIHIEKLYLLHQGVNEKPNHDKRHCDLEYQNSSLFVCKINFWMAQAARSDVLKCLLVGAGFRKSPLHAQRGYCHAHKLSKVRRFQST